MQTLLGKQKVTSFASSSSTDSQVKLLVVPCCQHSVFSSDLHENLLRE